jgi:hypothetical protein
VPPIDGEIKGSRRFLAEKLGGKKLTGRILPRDGRLQGQETVRSFGKMSEILPTQTRKTGLAAEKKSASWARFPGEAGEITKTP